MPARGAGCYIRFTRLRQKHVGREDESFGRVEVRHRLLFERRRHVVSAARDSATAVSSLSSRPARSALCLVTRLVTKTLRPEIYHVLEQVVGHGVPGNDPRNWHDCVAGTSMNSLFIGMMRSAGLERVVAEPRHGVDELELVGAEIRQAGDLMAEADPPNTYDRNSRKAAGNERIGTD
jgi:hypothetical protein